MTPEQLIGAALVDPDLARPLLKNFQGPAKLRPVVAAINQVLTTRDGFTPEAVAAAMSPEDLEAVGNFTGLIRMAIDADMDQARAMVASASIQFTDIAEELLHPVEPSMLIDPLLEDHTTAALIGESAAGKSFTAIALSCSCSTGFQFAGHTVKRTGLVFYFAGEGRHGIPRRVKAWQDHHGVTIPKGRLFLPKGRIEFNLEGARRVAEAMTDLVDQHGSPVLVVIDTLARSLPAGADENSSRDMMDFVNAVELLRDRFGCVVLIVHHSGHAADAQGRARGSSAFRAAMDTEILVDRRKRQLRWTKMKDAETPPPIPFELVQVGASAVAVYGDPQQASAQELTKAESFALSTLQETFERLKRTWATVEEWRVDFYRRHPGDTSVAKRQAYHRARTDLVNKGFLRVDNDAYAINVTGVTERDKSHRVTGEGDRDKRDTPPLGGVTLSRLTVTPPELVDVELPDLGEPQ